MGSGVFGCLEVGEEGGVLLEIGLDHFQACLQPALEPAFTDFVFDPVEMQVAVSHAHMIGTRTPRHNGPDGLT
jgi:hypothetical protein